MEAEKTTYSQVFKNLSSELLNTVSTGQFARIHDLSSIQEIFKMHK